MKSSIRFPLFLSGLGVVLLSASGHQADAPAPAPHFRLVEPISWIIEDQRGDPQKAGPCGGTNSDWGTPSYVVNEARGGSMLHLKVEETIYHPGHYRVALAVNSPLELPPDPETQTIDTERGPRSVSATIQDPPQIPVLVDGLWAHDTRPSSPQTFEADVRLPNIFCRQCILQVVQWMADHAYNNPGGYSYHHCAHVQITADPSLPLETGWPAER
jgi:hypothetical protein